MTIPNIQIYDFKLFLVIMETEINIHKTAESKQDSVEIRT